MGVLHDQTADNILCVEWESKREPVHTPGSAGAQTFPGFRKYVIEVQATRIRTFLNISATGMVTNLRGELEDLEHANVNRAIQTIVRGRIFLKRVSRMCRCALRLSA